jgi:hypothetical protein
MFGGVVREPRTIRPRSVPESAFDSELSRTDKPGHDTDVKFSQKDGSLVE